MMFCLVCGCGTTAKTTMTEETDPFDAVRRNAVERKWIKRLESAEHLLETQSATAQSLNEGVEGLTTLLKKAPENANEVISPRLRRRIKETVAQLRHRHRMTAEAAAWSREHPRAVLRGPSSFRWPIQSPQVVSGFGLRLDPFGSERRTFHNGVDISAPVGTPVRTIARGEVVASGFRNDGCGLGVTIVHPGGYASDYCHLSRVFVNPNDLIQDNTLIGQVGTTGRTTGAHLHWSVWYRGAAIDPLEILRGRSRAAHGR